MNNFDDFKVTKAIPNNTNIGDGLTIVDYLTQINFSNKPNSKKYLVIHYTAGTVDNGSAALGNAKYFKSVNRGASAHFFVDSTSKIYRVVSEDLVAWHCGTKNAYYHPECRNSNSIGVEICSYKENGVYKFRDDTYSHALSLCRYLVKKYKIPKERVLMHYNITHKVCPAPFLSNSKPTAAWDKFRDLIFNDSTTINTDEESVNVRLLKSLGKVVNTNGSVLNLRKGPGTTYSIIGEYEENDTVNIIGMVENWYKLDNGGFVNSSYIKLYDWADVYRDDLLSKGIISNKDEWSKYSSVLTKALAVQLISNIYGNVIKSNDDKHWADPAVNNLIKHNVISDKSQWQDLDSPINKAMFLALVNNSCGGVLDKYRDRTPDHWGRNHLDSLCDKGIISTPETWVDFEAQVQYDICLALISKLLTIIK